MIILARFILAIIAILTIQGCSGADKSEAVGPCVHGLCPMDTFCETSDNQCYPKKAEDPPKTVVQRDENATPKPPPNKPDSIGDCVNGLCPKGFECRDNACHKVKAPAAAEGGTPSADIGPCVNEKCPEGYTCNTAEYKCYAQL